MKRKNASVGESVAQQLTQRFVTKMQGINYASESPQTIGAVIQQFTEDLTAAVAPNALTSYVPCASSEEFLSRCKAFGEAITQATDQDSMWKAFDKLAGK